MNRISKIIAFIRPAVTRPVSAALPVASDPDGLECYFDQVPPRAASLPAQTALDQMYGYYDAA